MRLLGKQWETPYQTVIGWEQTCLWCAQSLIPASFQEPEPGGGLDPIDCCLNPLLALGQIAGLLGEQLAKQ